MDGDQRLHSIGFALLAITVCTISVCTYLYYSSVIANAFKYGYQQQTLVGYSSPVWVKAQSTNAMEQNGHIAQQPQP
jgi:hypothetical protein